MTRKHYSQLIHECILKGDRLFVILTTKFVCTYDHFSSYSQSAPSAVLGVVLFTIGLGDK